MEPEVPVDSDAKVVGCGVLLSGLVLVASPEGNDSLFVMDFWEAASLMVTADSASGAWVGDASSVTVNGTPATLVGAELWLAEASGAF